MFTSDESLSVNRLAVDEAGTYHSGGVRHISSHGCYKHRTPTEFEDRTKEHCLCLPRSCAQQGPRLCDFGVSRFRR